MVILSQLGKPQRKSNIAKVESVQHVTRPRGYKKISCSTQLSMKIFLLVNVKMPTVVGILTFTSRKNSIPGLSESENS